MKLLRAPWGGGGVGGGSGVMRRLTQAECRYHPGVYYSRIISLSVCYYTCTREIYQQLQSLIN